MLLASACGSEHAQPPPQKPAPPPLEFLGAWGTRGDGPGQLSSPTGIAADTVGNVYLVEAFNRFLHKFSSKGEPLLSFQDDGIKNPGSIALDSGGAIYVAPYSGGQILVFLPDGERFRVLRSRSGPRFEGISSVCVDANGSIFISEFEAHRLRKLGPNGRPIAVWGRKNPGDTNIGRLGPAALGPDGFLYVSDHDNSMILKMNQDLEPSKSWSVPEAFRPVISLAASRQFVFAAISGGRIAVWTPEGDLKHVDNLGGQITAQNTPPPFHLALGRSNELLVLDALRARVFRFRINF